MLILAFLPIISVFLLSIKLPMLLPFSCVPIIIESVAEIVIVLPILIAGIPLYSPSISIIALSRLLLVGPIVSCLSIHKFPPSLLFAFGVNDSPPSTVSL